MAYEEIFEAEQSNPRVIIKHLNIIKESYRINPDPISHILSQIDHKNGSAVTIRDLFGVYNSTPFN